MSRSKVSPRRALVAVLVLAATAASAAEPVSSPRVTGVEMAAPVRQMLQQLADQWEQWLGAFYQKRPERGESAVAGLLATAHQLGMARLPDLSLGASVRAVQAARQGDFPRARWALETAERLDPGRPETAFAAATVDRLAGSWLRLPGSFLRGYPRLFWFPLERYLWWQDLLLWTLWLLLLSGGLFVALQMAAKGGALYRDLFGFLSRRLPPPAAFGAVALLLLWPLFLPFGVLWLVLLWSLVLWGYASPSERAVLTALWLLLGLAPSLIAEQRRRVAVTLSPPVQAMQSLEQRRLYGGLFTDLGVLRSLLPESAAVKHLLADLHRSLNQWDLARSLYRQVLESEPDNTAALLNLGAFFYYKGDFGNAIPSFQKAAAADPKSAAAQYDLSQAYSDSYLFDDSKRALAQAREIDGAKVDLWIRNADQQRVVVSSAGMARIPEIRRQLLDLWRTREASSARLELLRRGLSMALSLGLVLVAVALHLARRPFGYAETAAAPVRSRRRERWRRTLLPGLPSAEAGEGAKAFLAVLLPAGLAMLPLFERLGYRIPWGYDPGNLASWIVAILGLLLYFGARLRWELRNDV
jgi:tetratricopeptide (TPR) repeat protein